MSNFIVGAAIFSPLWVQLLIEIGKRTVHGYTTLREESR